MTTDAKVLEEKTQEIYLVAPNGDVYFIEYKTYISKVICKWSVDNPEGPFLKDGQLPINILGQTVTKVIQWNLDEFVTPELIQAHNLKPGFLLDLRGLAMPKQTVKNPTVKTATNPSLPIEDSSNVTIVNVPQDILYQLRETPELNLYIASWQNPLENHNQLTMHDSQLSYISFNDLEKVSKKRNLDDIPIDTKLSETEKTMQYLKDYYVDVGVQTGAINALDQSNQKLTSSTNGEANQDAAFIFCYITNLKSFNQS